MSTNKRAHNDPIQTSPPRNDEDDFVPRPPKRAHNDPNQMSPPSNDDDDFVPRPPLPAHYLGSQPKEDPSISWKVPKKSKKQKTDDNFKPPFNVKPPYDDSRTSNY